MFNLKGITILLALLYMSGCSAVSSLDWSPLAIWSDSEVKTTEPEEVRLYYISSTPIDDSFQLSARQRSGNASAVLSMEILESQTIVNHAWSGDSLCYAYKMQLSTDGMDTFRSLQADETIVRAPRAEDGIGWLRGRESQLIQVDESSDPTLEEWLALQK